MRVHHGFVLIILFVCQLAISKAAATVIYDFYGQCETDCDGKAHGILVLDSHYIPGTAVLPSDYISWQYFSNTGSYELNAPENFGFNGLLGTLPRKAGRANFFIDFGGDNTFFLSGSRTGLDGPPNSGSWINTGPEPSACGIFDCDNFNFVKGEGANHKWVLRVDEPGTASLLFLCGVMLCMPKLKRLTRRDS